MPALHGIPENLKEAAAGLPLATAHGPWVVAWAENLSQNKAGGREGGREEMQLEKDLMKNTSNHRGRERDGFSRSPMDNLSFHGELGLPALSDDR